MTPADSFRHFLIACLLGLGLGVLYGFLRPLRKKHPHISDLLFLPGLFWAWLQLNFGVCLGDLRLGCNMGLAVGILAWELTVGKLLRPFFSLFWKCMEKIWQTFLLPFRIFLKFFRIFLNFLLANLKKMGRIKCNIRPNSQSEPGGTDHEER